MFFEDFKDLWRDVFENDNNLHYWLDDMDKRLASAQSEQSIKKLFGDIIKRLDITIATDTKKLCDSIITDFMRVSNVTLVLNLRKKILIRDVLQKSESHISLNQKDNTEIMIDIFQEESYSYMNKLKNGLQRINN